MGAADSQRHPAADAGWGTPHPGAPAPAPASPAELAGAHDDGWGPASGRDPAGMDETVRVVSSPSQPPGLANRPPEAPLAFARERLVVFPRNLPVAQHPSGLVIVQAAKGFAARIDGIRSMAAAPGVPARPLSRIARGRVLDEPLGGLTAPIHEIGGRCELVLGAPEGRRLQALSLADDPLYLREDAISGFELSIVYENGRLPTGDGEAIPMVQLRGRGALIACVPERAVSIEVMSGRATITRAASVIGWLGRLVPRALPPSEAPAGLRGLAQFAGEGMVIIDGR